MTWRSAPDGHLFAQVGPPHSTQVLFQEYSSTGGYENQFISPPGGLAIGPSGDIFAGSRTKRRIDRLSRSGKLLETLGTGHFTGFPVVGAVDRTGDVYAFDEAKNDVSTILKFAPVVPQTTITAHPPSTLQIPTATFRFKSSIPGATLECRLRKAGASPPAFKPCSSPTTYNAQLERELHVRGKVDLTSRPRRSHAGQVQVQGPAPVSPDGDHLHSGQHDRSRRARRSPSRAPARARRSPAASRRSDPRHRHSRRVRARSPTYS